MGGELRLKARAREARAMARPSEMKNKRKEVEVADEGDTGGSEKRSKLNVSSEADGREKPSPSLSPAAVPVQVPEPVPEPEPGNSPISTDPLLETVQRILEKRRRKRMRPLPALMGDKPVDLIALHSRVESMGGYSKVTEARMWGSISDVLGLGQECGPGLKLVFVKYLKALESDRHSRDVKDVRGSRRLDAASQPSSSELRTHSTRGSVLWEETRHENGEDLRGDSGSDKEDALAHAPGASLTDDETIGDLRSRRHRDSQLECRQSCTSEDWAPTYASVEHLGGNPSGRGNEAHGADEGSGVSEDWYEGAREESVHLQQEALHGMIEWIKRVALCPGDSTAGVGTPGSGQDDDWVSQCQLLTAQVRSVLWKDSRGGDGSMQTRAMPFAHYDEAARPDAQALERMHSARERLAQIGFQPPPGPKFNHQDRNDGSYWGTPAGQRSGRQTVNYNEAALSRQQQRKRIPIGPDFQAEEVRWVPRDPMHMSGDPILEDAAGEGPSGSDDEDDADDSRWLGVRVWPQPEQGDIVSSLVRVGRGRPPCCECADPGSINCVRMHIAVARERLRMELGQSAWVEMGFHLMGEDVADLWTKEDERAFRLVARSYTLSKNSNFWDHLPRALPFKTRKELISYYFNVFVLRRRALQNRSHEAKVDSDDDEGVLPGESDSSGDDDSEDDEEDEDDDDLSDGADDAASEEVSDAIIYPLKTPMDSTRVPKYRALPDFNYSPTEPEVARIDRAQIHADLDADNHLTDHADESHVVLVWDDKHLESSSLVRDHGVLSQEWQDPHWHSGREQQEAVSSRQLSPPIPGKDHADVRQVPPLGDLWSQNMEMAPKREKDRLLSTNGMILELFGDDCECAGMLDSESNSHVCS